MGKFIKWRPENREPYPFEERVLSRPNFEALGVDQDALTWNRANGWMVPRSKISDEAWPYVVGDTGFVVVEQDNEEAGMTDYSEMDYRQLQEAAKAAGLPAGGSADEIRQRLDEHEANQPGQEAAAGDPGMNEARVTSVDSSGSAGTSGASAGATGSVGGSTGGASGSVGGSTTS